MLFSSNLVSGNSDSQNHFLSPISLQFTDIEIRDLLQVLANRKTGETGAMKFEFNNGIFERKDWVNAKQAKDDKDLDDFVKGVTKKF
jgi:hypothetical protein